MQARFLLGPAGSGKTYRCLGEIRAELLARPAGPSLIFLAPKQATFQIERQLLEDRALPGYTRLQIVSFERLAEMVLEETAGPQPKILSEEGRVMVLRALLAAREKELRIFHATARLPGFAQQLGLLLRELQRHQLAPERLGQLAEGPGLPPQLRGKLNDLALLLGAYLEWLKAQGLQDPSRLLDLATVNLRAPNGAVPWRVGGLWLDGFAEMTPQELDLLAALVPQCESATVAFCLEDVPKEDVSWLSTWSVVSQTFRHCYLRLEAATGQKPLVEVLPRAAVSNRFAANPALAHLEQHWAEAKPPAYAAPPHPGLLPQGGEGNPPRLVACANPEAEAILAAREIRRHVRAGGRFREVAVLVRRLDTHVVFLRRVFARYEIPSFIDQREPVAHHPLAELTRYALRTVAYNWRQADWFGALKSGLVHADEAELDRLENEALERGWEGPDWQQSFQFDQDDHRLAALEKLRERLARPFLQFRAALEPGLGGQRFTPTGAQLAKALRGLWDDLRVSETLERWSTNPALPTDAPPAVHATVWQELHAWLDNVELAFATQAMSLRDWLPVLEAGLGQLTVGVIPPALDQVMIGAIDRSRNPDLQLALVLGLNETQFPAPPAPARLLSEEERAALEKERVFLGLNARWRLGHERYYGYIACTRARRQLILTWAEADPEGDALNPSPFIDQVRRMFPGAPVETFAPAPDWQASEHRCEVLTTLLQAGNPLAPWLDGLSAELAPLRAYAPDEALTPAVAEALYGKVLHTSVSAIEKFGMCPFRFFANAGLGAEERKFFEVDALQIGSFQHEVLACFHQELESEGKRWRDVSATEARQRIERLARAVARGFNLGLFEARAQNKFTRDALSEALQDFIEVVIGWMNAYQFDPVRVELGFGLPDAPLPPWQLNLGEGHRLAFRGRIDRIDLCLGERPNEYLCVVMDYKSSARKLDPVLLEHGIQMQLPAYLSVLRHVKELRLELNAAALRPVGVFYVNLRGNYETADSRGAALDDPAAAKRKAYQHAGRFDFSAWPRLDAVGDSRQFNCRLKKDGQPNANCTDPLNSGEFLALLERVETNLRRMGREIFQGAARVDPYQKKMETACDQCECAAICRIDFWKHPFRRLPSKPGLLVPTTTLPEVEEPETEAPAPRKAPTIPPCGQLSLFD